MTIPSDLTGWSEAELRREARRLVALKNPALLGRFVRRDFHLRAHTKVIGQALAGLGTAYDRLLITSPPQVGKSALVSELAPIWWLATHPGDRIAITSYAMSLAVQKSRAVRTLIEQHGPRLAEHLRLAPGNSAVQDWSIISGGGLRAVGVGGGLTGNRVDLGFCDDPHKDRKEADSALQRERVWDWWSSVFLTRLRPGASACLTLTRWHPDDLAGRVLAHEGRDTDGGRWHVIHLEALATGAVEDPMGRAVGEPMTHPAIRDDDVQALLAHWQDKRSTSTPRDWGALFQGDPQPPEGALVTLDQLAHQVHEFDASPPLRPVVAVDPSGGGRDTAGVVAGYLGRDQRVYLTHDRSGVLAAHQWARRAIELALTTGADAIVYESNFGGSLVPVAINAAWDKLLAEGKVTGAEKPYLRKATAKSSKRVRAEPVAQALIEDRMRLAARLPELMQEWASFDGGGESPGRVDASVWLYWHLAPLARGSSRLSSPVGISRSAIGGGSSASPPPRR